jgi:restriction system protein
MGVMMKWWMVRAGDHNELIPIWKQKGVASIGWAEFGDPKNYSTRKALIEKAHEIYEEEKPATRKTWASQVWRFSHEIKVGDRIITYAKDKREYLIGTVTKEHEYNETIVSDYYPNVIHVTHISHPPNENREDFFVPMSNESLTHKESEGVFLS